MRPCMWNQVAALLWVAALCSAAAAVGAPAGVRAAGGDTSPGARASSRADALSSPDPAVVSAAIDKLGERNDRVGRRALAAFLRAGQPDALTDRALLALGRQTSADNLGVLTEFTRHRRPAARLLAFTAISRIAVPAADDLLGAGLRDSDPAVRALCARRLGERVAYRQLDLLFRALERGLPEAGYAIGRIADAAGIARFEQQLGRLPIATMLPGYEQLLLRANVTEAQKLELIAHLGEVASPSVKNFLRQLRAHPALAGQTRVLLALAQTERLIAPLPPRPAPTQPAAPAALTREGGR